MQKYHDEPKQYKGYLKSALEVGSRLGHYDGTALIGEGGMGQVYNPTDIQNGGTRLLAGC